MAELIHRVREVCLELPEVSERISHGQPAFFVRGKRTLAMFRPEQSPPGLWCPCEPEARRYWVEFRPDEFHVPPYMGPLGWVGIHLTAATDWDLVQRVVDDAYRRVASKKLVALHHAQTGRA